MSALGRTKIGLLSAALMFGAAAIPSMAQQPPDNNNGNNGGGNNGGGRRGGFDPAQMMQRMEQRLQEELGMSDDEFSAIKPNVETLAQIQFATSGYGGRGRGGPGRGGPGGGGPGGGGQGGGGQGGGGQGGGNAGGGGGDTAASTMKVDPAVTALQEKQKDLQATIDNKDSTADDLKTKLQAFRDAKAALKAQSTKAQDELKSALTQKQEAVLVMRGMLE